ncbi:MAG TPA: hypothetical protein VMR33_15610 [Candidatus Baltobacteraceae bacterium]|jgi:hypothetical protein|nr:hypothetical protein [Candidatus Baltobacteraceae bacterium]
MQKREIIWIAVLLVLIVAYFHFFGGRFGQKAIAIHASLRPSQRAETAVYPVYFTLNDDFKLTSLKVVPLEDGKVNPATMPVWNLVSDSNSAPTRAFFYGQHIRGMKPALANVQADPLTPGVIYRILLSSGKLTAALDFKTRSTTE